RRESSMPSSTRTGSRKRASASIVQATTTVPTCSACAFGPILPGHKPRNTKILLSRSGQEEAAKRGAGERKGTDMAERVADYVLGRLTEWGVHRIYGYPGDGINAFLGAFDRAGGDPEFIQVRHEEMAAFMACGHAKFTGEVGVCIATSGPGAIHLLNGLYDAKLDHQPVVALVGQQAMASLGGNYQQEVDLTTLFKDVAHEYVHMA